MSTKADRIRWLAELSAERRAERARLVRVSVSASEEFKPVIRAVVMSDVIRPKGNALTRILTRLVKTQAGRCYICRRRFGSGTARPTLDHVVPIALGGTNRRNLAAACWQCNNDKAATYPTPAMLAALAQINAGYPPETTSGSIDSTTIGNGSLCLIVTSASVHFDDGNADVSRIPVYRGSG